MENEKRRLYNVEYREKNRDSINASNLQSYHKNKHKYVDLRRKHAKLHRERHPDANRQANKRWRERQRIEKKVWVIEIGGTLYYPSAESLDITDKEYFNKIVKLKMERRGAIPSKRYVKQTRFI